MGGDDLLLADQNTDDENDDDMNDDDVNVENNQEEEESSSDEEIQIHFIEEDEDEQPQQLQDAIREQQQIQSLENQLAAERVLLCLPCYHCNLCADCFGQRDESNANSCPFPSCIQPLQASINLNEQ